MTAPEIIRVDPPMTGDERALLTGFLDFLRATVHVKAEGLTDEDAHRSTVRSPLLTVAGVVSHLRWVESYWFGVVLGRLPDLAPQRNGVPDGDFTSAHGRPLADLLAEYAAECAVSRRVLAALDLDTEVPYREEGLVSVRWIVIHMVEETGRHAGQLDIVRENLDGVTGE